MSYEVEAWLNLNGGDDVGILVEVSDDATDEQIDEAVKNAIMDHLDWGWEDPYDDITDTYPCGCCMCCGCSCDFEYEDMWIDEDLKDE